jgi:hypothetical protein
MVRTDLDDQKREYPDGLAVSEEFMLGFVESRSQPMYSRLILLWYQRPPREQLYLLQAADGHEQQRKECEDSF